MPTLKEQVEQLAALEKAPTATVTVRMPKAKIDRLKVMAEDAGVDHVTLVRKLIEVYITS